jgi:cell division transport system permease protein
VGATEFFIRGPFYVEGFLQGLLGGLVASGSLWGVYHFLHARGRGSLVSTVLVLDFLKPQEVAFLILLGGAAGLFGAVASLRREAL